jgi:Bacterial SH3 domain
MKPLLFLVIACLMPWLAQAETMYVSDELVLGVYSDKAQSERVATLKSGASLEVLARDGEYVQVRLGDAREGWVKASYLTQREPAAARVKKLEDDLRRLRGGGAAKTDPAAAAEIARLSAALAAKQNELDAAQGSRAAPVAPPQGMPRHGLWSLIAIAIAGAGGFLAGYQLLARRLRQKFGGIKVY